ncbi:N-acetyltransferase family protein [Longispora urticae]
MHVREWNPATAPGSDLEAWRLLYNEMLAADMPGEPHWRADNLRAYMAVTMPDENRADWFAEHDGAVVGVADLLLLDDLGVVEVYVSPDHRRKGVARTLLAHAVRRAHESGRTVLGAEVAAGTPATAFYKAYGFQLTCVEQRNLLDLATVDWDRLREHAARTGSGYRIEYFPGGPPTDLLTAYATAKQVVQGDWELHPSSYSPDRLAHSLATLHARGLTPHVVCAVHNRTGAVAGLTEVVASALHPERADQYDTVVVPAHRGYGLGLAMKARMLLELRDAVPDLRDVQTWQSVENEPMARVNAELGFLPDREWHEYEASVPALAAQLGV